MVRYGCRGIGLRVLGLDSSECQSDRGAWHVGLCARRDRRRYQIAILHRSEYGCISIPSSEEPTSLRSNQIRAHAVGDAIDHVPNATFQ